MTTEAITIKMETLRRRILEKNILPYIKEHFTTYPQLKSAMLLIAQYWESEAKNAVHSHYIFSILYTPDLEAFYRAERQSQTFYNFIDDINLPSLGTPWDLIDNHDYWDSNGIAIPAFAAFCKAGADKNDNIEEAYSPYAIFRRQREKVEIEIIGKKLRPWLEGMLPEED